MSAKLEQLAFDLDARLEPDRDDCIWGAAFFDGEGCVNLCAINRGRGVRAQIIVTNTDLPILEWYRERWGGAIYDAHPGTQRQPAFQWQLADSRAIPFLEDIRPHLKLKIPQTDNCLAFLHLKALRRKHSYTTPEERAEHKRYLDAHKALDLTHGGQKRRPRVVA